MNYNNDYDVAVIGAGHAGCEAALAAARLSMKTAIFTLSLDNIANMPCNPSIGGTAKGHLVREIDALGGEMGKIADVCTIQSRMLNRGKGPAVHSLRAQIDRELYHSKMKQSLENQSNLDIIQAEITDIITENNAVTGLVTSLGIKYSAKSIIIATGTYLKSTIFVGNYTINAGPDNSINSIPLSDSLAKIGITLRRFKTGTPARIHADTINYSQIETQSGDEPIIPFSKNTTITPKNLVDCYITYTNENTHQIITENIQKSAMYSGKIEGVGPRYCPSIEDKIIRFPDKPRHQLFIEPMGLNTKEMYLQGISTSMPVDVQNRIYRSIKGLENAHIMRNAYAIEYDCCDSLELNPTLEFIKICGLYGAGQFNGTSGYEEAAAQGLVAGINASLKITGKDNLILGRESSYIGTLIDDLTTKGCTDPYRMMTSRSEFRLILRQDNAEERLIKYGYDIGLVSEEKYNHFCEMFHVKHQEIKRLEKITVPPSEKLNDLLERLGTAPIITGIKLSELIKRPQISYTALSEFDQNRPKIPDDVIETLEIDIKYEGYIKRQLIAAENIRKMNEKLIPQNIDYSKIKNLRLEAVEKLTKIRPLSIGMASRISGVNPADITNLLIYLKSIS